MYYLLHDTECSLHTYLELHDCVLKRIIFGLDNVKIGIKLAYRLAHLLLPLQYKGNGMITRKFDVAIENDTFSEYSGDMYSILLTWK